MNIGLSFLSIVASLSIAGTALAQQQVELTGGFGPEPVSLEVYAGGPKLASDFGQGCAGMVAETPDVQLRFTGYGGPLRIVASGPGDTSLLVNGPDGRWYCNDDFNGTDPQVSWSVAGSGVYDIWLGAVTDSASSGPTTIYIIE